MDQGVLELQETLVLALPLVTLGVILGVFISVARHKVHTVQQDILVHALQHFTDRAKTGTVACMVDANLELRTTQAGTLRSLTAHAVFGVRQSKWLCSRGEMFFAKGDVEDAICHVLVAAFNNALDLCAALGVSRHVAGQRCMTISVTSHEVFYPSETSGTKGLATAAIRRKGECGSSFEVQSR